MKLPTSLKDIVSFTETLVCVEDLSSKKGFLQSLNPLVKLVVTVFMIVMALFIVLLPYLVVLCIIPVVLALVSKIPLRSFMSKVFLIPAFAAIISLPTLFVSSGSTALSADLGLFTLSITFEGLQRFLIFSVRVWFCVASLTLFSLSTGFDAILRLLASIRVPSIVIQLFGLTYRYFFVSIHELQKVILAKEARTYVNRRTLSLESLRRSGALLATLFIRTYERSERVYLAMKSRGFGVDHTIKSPLPTFRPRDFLFGAAASLFLGLLVFL